MGWGNGAIVVGFRELGLLVWWFSSGGYNVSRFTLHQIPEEKGVGLVAICVLVHYI